MAIEKDELRTVLSLVGASAYSTRMMGAATATRGVGVASTQTAGGMLSLQAAMGPVTIILGAVTAAAVAAAAAIAAVGAVAAVTAKQAVEFETALVGVEAQSGYTAEEMRGVHEQILNLDSALAKADLVSALQAFAFAGFEAETALEGMGVAAQAAEAFAADAGVTAMALLKVMTAYNVEARDSAAVMDLLATSAAQGELQLEEMARFLPRVAVAASNAGTSLNDMTAAVEAYSHFAGSAELTTTYLTGLFRALANEGFALEISQRGLVAVLRDIGEETNMSRAALQELLGSAEAVDAFVGLATGDFQALETAMMHSADAAGMVAGALAIRRDSVMNALDRTKASLEAMKIRLGEVVLLWSSDYTQALAIAAKAIQIFATAQLELATETKRTSSENKANYYAMARGIVVAMGTIVDVILQTAGIIALLSAPFFQLAQAITFAIIKIKQVQLALAEFRSGGRTTDHIRALRDDVRVWKEIFHEAGGFVSMLDPISAAMEAAKPFGNWRKSAKEFTAGVLGNIDELERKAASADISANAVSIGKKFPAPSPPGSDEDAELPGVARVAAIDEYRTKLRRVYETLRAGESDRVRLAQIEVRYRELDLAAVNAIVTASARLNMEDKERAALEEKYHRSRTAHIKAETSLEVALARVAEKSARDAERAQTKRERLAERARMNAVRDYKRVADIAMRANDVVQKVIGGQMGAEASEAIQRITGQSIARGRYNLAGVRTDGSSTITLEIKAPSDMPEAQKAQMASWLRDLIREGGKQGIPLQ